MSKVKNDSSKPKVRSNKRTMSTRSKRKAKSNVKSSQRGRKRKRVSEELKVFVVDEHNDAMLPFLDAVNSGKLPKSGIKMLHYDSHPDLGNPSKVDPNNYMRNFSTGKCDRDGIHSLTDIATWITPLVVAGYLDEVIWMAGDWCHQIEEGSYELVCGVDKKTGQLKTAAAKGKNCDNPAVEDYWECDGTAGPLKKLVNRKRWTLHVFKHTKKGKLPDDHFFDIVKIIGDSTWVLDIDEDFFSCNNPHRDDFSACFGDGNWKLIKKIYDIGAPWDVQLEKILQKKQFLKPWKDFLKLTTVKKVMKGLEEEELNAKDLLKKFHKLLKSQYKKEYEDGVNIEELFALDDFHTAGLYSSLPHHLSRATEIVELGNATEELLNYFAKNAENLPVHVTLATSRADRYLPDCQAAIIHQMLDIMMEVVFENVDIVRMDKPEFSINFIEEDESDAEMEEPASKKRKLTVRSG